MSDMDCVELEKPKTGYLDLITCIDRFSRVLVNTTITNFSYETIILEKGLHEILNILLICRDRFGTAYIAGNGGSAAIASHAVIDFLNMAKMKATAMLDPAVTTCLSNDYGYEYVYAKQLARFIQSEDVLIAISSSGNSKNIINAVDVAKNQGATVITLSGFTENNVLRQIGHYNLWLNSKEYGQVEIGHAFILHYLTDRLRELL